MKKIDKRLTPLLGVLGLFACLIFARYAQLAFSPARSMASDEALEGERGSIVDRNGHALAMDVPKYDISVWRPATNVGIFEKEIPQLASIMGVPADQLLAKYRDGNQNYFYAAKRLGSESAERVKAGIKAGRYKGVQVDEISGRLYPEGKLASHLVGFTGEGNAGLDGIEVKYDDKLSPKPRKAGDGTGRLLDSEAKKPQGDKVILTVDANLQFSIEEIMDQAIKANGAESAFAVVMDVRTGEILAYVGEPGFDLNDYGSYSSEMRKDPLSLFSYEPGSVFKIFSMSSILDIGAIDENTIFDCDGAYRRTLPNGEKIVIKDLGVYGKQNLSGILAHSSNAGVGYASDRISEADLFARLSSFGFGMKTGVGLSGESPGLLRDPEKWSARSKPTIAIGQEVLVTPLQMITAAAAIANGGLLLKPTAVARIETADGEIVFKHETQVVRRVVSEETAKTMMKALETVASLQGTGWRAKVADVRMAVKTGTAQMIDPQSRAYSDKDYIASTLGIFPADAPKVALYVALVKPRGASYLGGQIAAPVLKEVAEAVLSIIDLNRGKTPTVVHNGDVSLPLVRRANIGLTMPDLAGYSKRELLPLLERSDLKVIIEGEGYVRSQKPLPGESVNDGSTIYFRLK
ncbi:MAG: penicillin-binding protein [Spirochaetes bacterium]|nr:penicillin-binding protein [Spirochaetota bacterium]